MWLVRWFGREDPDPRRRRLESRCQTLASACALARRIALQEGVGVEVVKVDGDVAGVVVGSRSVRRVVDDNGMCVHELKAEWCALCR